MTLLELVTFLHVPFTRVNGNTLNCAYEIDCSKCANDTLCGGLSSSYVDDHLLLELTQQHPELLI